MKDYTVLEKIKNSAQSCDVPDSLRPENITLEEKNQTKTIGINNKIYRIAGCAAAALVLIVAVAFVNRDVSKEESGVVAMPEEATVPKAVEEDGEDIESLYALAKDYDEIYDYIKANDYAYVVYDMEDGIAVEEAAVESAAPAEAEESMAAEMPAMEAGGAAMDYSETNTQVEGVDEGDIVKTDGNYLYILKENKEVQIVEVSAGKMKEVSVIRPEMLTSDVSIVDMYLSKDKLQLVCQRYENQLQEESEDFYYMDYRVVTGVYTYDITKREQPKKLGMIEQDGSYHTSRKVDGYLYLFTSYYPNKDVMDQNDYHGVVPIVGEEVLPASDVYIPQEACEGNYGYMIISSIDENKPSQIKDKKAILEHANRFYVSTENIYLQKEMWNRSITQTEIAKFSYHDGIIKGEAAAVINGVVTDDFANNEYNGYLRVLTTQWYNGTNSNNVYVLDDKLKIVGKIEGLAEDETIYSARFFGNIGYFVTYRQVDPLFSVDFSNPRNPKVIGELKITGFSEYLHFYGKDRLLGVGWETDPDTGSRKGLKLSMFDISDPSDVKEIDKIVVKNIDYFPGEWDYKAFTVSESKNIIGFLTSSYDYDGQMNQYMVYSYDNEDGFKTKLNYNLQDNGYGLVEKTRGVYIGDTFYVVTQDAILAFDMKHQYEKIGELY